MDAALSPIAAPCHVAPGTGVRFAVFMRRNTKRSLVRIISLPPTADFSDTEANTRVPLLGCAIAWASAMSSLASSAQTGILAMPSLSAASPGRSDATTLSDRALVLVANRLTARGEGLRAGGHGDAACGRGGHACRPQGLLHRAGPALLSPPPRCGGVGAGAKRRRLDRPCRRAARAAGAGRGACRFDLRSKWPA
jgi:hypothetical protein